VKSQIEAMGGTISIASIVNKGTTFTLTFKTNNMLDRILCIDDDPITLMLCKKGNCEDYVFNEIITAQNGESA
jgi:predicted transglutaminase-like protease